MNTPLYQRKWFKIGVLLLAIGLFSYFFANYRTEKYEEEFPELGKNEREIFLEKVQTPGEIKNEELTKEQKDRRFNVRMLHGLYSMYITVGWVFMVLGIISILLSTKEPQVPVLDDEDEKESGENNNTT